MATPATKSKSKKEKERKASLPLNERLKSVVRRLPANLPEDIFWQSVQQWVTEETSVWKIYYQGKLRKKLNKENIPSRAYIAFKSEEQLALFGKEFDGHVFRDKTGAESHAIVEFAPYPKVPAEKRKPDNRNATIEKDEDFISFLEALKASETAEPVSLESLIASSQPPPPPKTTPLLEALKAEKSANRDKEAILRNHAHYNQISTNPSRKDDKKKAGVTPSVPSKPEATAPNASNAGGSKKAPKKAQAHGGGGAPGPQNQKNTASSSQPPKNALNNPPASQAAKPAKPPRAPRPPPPAKQVTNANPVIAAASPAPLPEGEATPIISPPARRTRPMLGLASRQFEAALSGVAGLANAATERKRREKERELQNSVPGAGASTIASLSTSPGSGPVIPFARIDGSDHDTDKPAAPQSPKKDKTRRGGRSGGGGNNTAGVSSTSTSGSADPPQVTIPSILQRADGPPPGTIKKDGVNVAAGGILPAPSLSAVNPPANGNIRGGGGGRRGRGGGGRGRGAAVNAPRGG